VQTDSELEKTDAVLKAEGAPYLVRKLLGRWKAERKFTVGTDGHLVFNSRQISGGFFTMSTEEGTRQASSFFGYNLESVMSWEGEVLITKTVITSPIGTTTTTTSRHWLETVGEVNQCINQSIDEGDLQASSTGMRRSLLLVNHTISAGGDYKTWLALQAD